MRLCEQLYFHHLPSKEEVDLVLEDTEQLSPILEMEKILWFKQKHTHIFAFVIESKFPKEN